MPVCSFSARAVKPSESCGGKHVLRHAMRRAGCPRGVRNVLIHDQARLISENSIEGLAAKIREGLENPPSLAEDPESIERFRDTRIMQEFWPCQRMPTGIATEHNAMDARRPAPPGTTAILRATGQGIINDVPCMEAPCCQAGGPAHPESCWRMARM